MNDECLKCGIIISRFGLSQPVPAAPRYTVTGSPIRSVLEDAAEHHRRMRRARMQTRLIGTSLLLVVLFGGFAIYRTLIRGAAAYVGAYKNVEHVFGLNFPNPGWSHYSKDELDVFGIGGVVDGFWHGDNPDDPDILLVVHRGDVGMQYPDPFQGEAGARFEQATRDHLEEVMRGAGYEIEFTSTQKITLGGSSGSVFLADLVKKEKQLGGKFFCGYRYGNLYAVIMIGTPEQMDANETELNKIGKSLNFHISVI